MAVPTSTALGLTFYFLLVGRRPFVKADLPEILTRIAAYGLRPLARRVPTFLSS